MSTLIVQPKNTNGKPSVSTIIIPTASVHKSATYRLCSKVSHYWDCRMKGRPPGTPKSDDPAKRKRKRSARQRDLCDVKIKITEHFPGATFSSDGTIIHLTTTELAPREQFPGGIASPLGGRSTSTHKYWTIQRVNGNGGNGKADGIPGPHKHTLEKSDEIKKSTVQRFLAAQGKEVRKGQVLPHDTTNLCFSVCWPIATETTTVI